MIEINLPTKPASVNAIWRGRRFKTQLYLDYEKEISYLIKSQLPLKSKMQGEIEVEFIFHLKQYKRTDCDNLVKPLLDILVKNGIMEDDRKVVKVSAQKIMSNKDSIKIIIKKYDTTR